MPQITITVSQKLIDRAGVLTAEHNARTGESLTTVQMAKRILRRWAAAESVNALNTQAIADLETDIEMRRKAGMQAIQEEAETESATWD